MYLLLTIASLLSFCPLVSRASDLNQLPNYPKLGPYGDILGSLCGKEKVSVAPAIIPEIGCFSVNAGTAITGVVENRFVRISVDQKGDEAFFADDRRLDRVGGSDSNDPFIQASSSGYAFCRKDGPRDCPTTINAVFREPREFVVFVVAREFKPHSYVTTKENWAFEMSRRNRKP